ncbi:MAG: hypothetical protein L0H96_16230 [Humibacillus sp.]|nr:hypothetical protein [Humibacillus sp.]
MAVIAITSFSGAPGCTTLAVAWAYLNPRPVLLLEADPTGGSPVLAGPFRAELYHDDSVLNLVDYEGESLMQALWHHAYPLPDTTDRRALPTVAAHHQARSMGAMWPAISRAARAMSEQTGTDIVIDLGRRGMEYSPAGLLTGADLVICLTDATLPALNAARWGLDSLREDLAGSGDPDRAVLVTTRPHPGPVRGLFPGRRDAAPAVRPWSASEIRAITDPTPVLAELAFDRASAQVFSHGALGPREPKDNPYAKSVQALIGDAESHLAALTAEQHHDDLEVDA